MPYNIKKYLPWVILLLFVISSIAKYYASHHEVTSNVQITSPKSDAEVQAKHQHNSSSIPQKVYDVLDYIKKNHQAPNGYEGGREFKNREHQLLSQTPDGKRIHYQEWDVNPKVHGRNRGTERLITGDDGKAWYTNNHYQTFTEVT